MSDDKLVRMANQIATFFRSYPEEQAVAGISEHIVAFWSPAMRRDLQACADLAPAGLDPLVMAATRRIGSAQSPAHREAAGPSQLGQLGADDAG